MKKFLIVVSVGVLLVVGVLIAIPFFVSIDQFRPQIQNSIAQNIRGRVVLGELKLSLIPAIKVKVGPTQVIAPEPFDKAPFVQMSGAEFTMPLLSLLTGPKMNLALNGLSVDLVTQGAKNSVAETLPQATPAPTDTSKAASAPGEPPAAVGEVLNKLPPFIASRVKAARFSLSLNGASVEMRELTPKKGDLTKITDLNVTLKDIGIAVPMQLEASLVADVAIAGAALKGAIKNSGTITFNPDGAKNIVDLDLSQDLSGLDLAYRPLFHKAQGLAFGTALKGRVTQAPGLIEIDFKELGLRFASVQAGGTVAAKLDSADPTQGSFNAAFKVDDFEIASFGALIPLIRDYKLGGKVNVDLKAQGTADNPALNVLVRFSGITGATPELKKPLTDLQGQILVTGFVAKPKLRIAPVSLKLGSSDIAAEVEAEGIQKIVASIKVNSNKLDADELMGLQAMVIDPLAKAAPGTAPPTAEEKKAAAVAAAAPLDESLEQLAPTVEEALKNPLLDQVSATITANLKLIRLLGADFKNVSANVSLKNRKLQISKASLNAYGGQLGADLNLDLDEKALGYAMTAALKGVSLQEMTRIHMPSWQKELSGSINGEASLSGLGLRKAQLEQNLKGGLKGDMVDGRLNLPIVKMVSMVADSLPKIAGKPVSVPKANQNESFKGDFKTAKLACTIKGRSIELSTLDVVYDTLKTGIGELKFDATGQLTFDQKIDLLGTAYVSPKLIPVSQLKGKSGLIEFPLKISGTMSEPKPDVMYSVNIMGKRAIGVVADELKAKAQEEVNKLKKQAEDQAKQQAAKLAEEAAKKALSNAPAPVQKQADEIKNKLKKKFGI
jgi:uncharacterized protein involved in outer membrane biogenesis